MPRLTKDQKHDLVKQMVRARDRAKALYKQADELESQLLDAVRVDETFTMSDGRTVTLVDNFVGGNVAYKAAAVRQFEFIVRSPSKES